MILGVTMVTSLLIYKNITTQCESIVTVELIIYISRDVQREKLTIELDIDRRRESNVEEETGVVTEKRVVLSKLSKYCKLKIYKCM